MKAYKGTDKNMCCRGVQYEIGKTYTAEGEIKLCKNGFHACLNPIDIISYYPIVNENRYFEVELDGVSDEKIMIVKLPQSQLHLLGNCL